MRIYTKTERLQQLIEDRRSLHRIPEFSYDLPKTRAYLRNRLKAARPNSIESCDEGIKVVFRAANALQPAIAFRSDMDALLTEEKNTHDYVSEHVGMMHACGHDGHMAALLMLADIIAGRREALARDVVLLFQPAEENLGGAKRMIDAGAMCDPIVSEVYGMHVMPTLPIGTIGSCAGAMMASVDTIDIEIFGHSAHGATPQLGQDTMMSMAHFILNAQAALARRISPMLPVSFTVGSATAGKVYNIIPDHAKLLGSLRTYDPEVSVRALNVLRDTLKSADCLYATTSDLRVIQSYPPVINDRACVERLQALAGDAFTEIEPVSISEDFSEFERIAAGAYFFCGCGDAAYTSLLHSETFDFDEAALLTGVALFEKLIFEDNGGIQ